MTTQKFPGLVFPMLFICLASCSSRKAPPSELPKEPTGLTLTAQAAGEEYWGGDKIIYVTATLFNPTKDTINFISMYCSYSQFFLTDTSAFNVRWEDCNKNFETVISIPPGYKMDQLIHLMPRDFDVLKSVKPKIGMYLQLPKKEDLFNWEVISKLFMERESAPIIWSKPIDFNRLNRTPYK